MAKRTEVRFIFEEGGQYKQLTMKIFLNRNLRELGKFISKKVGIPLENLVLEDKSKLKPIGLLKDIEMTNLELVEKHGTSFNLVNVVDVPIELYITTKTISGDKYFRQFHKAKQDDIFKDLIPELMEWSGIQENELKIISFDENDNPTEVLKIDYNLKIPELVDKYGTDFEVVRSSWER